MAGNPSSSNGPGARQPRMTTSISISHAGGAAAAFSAFASEHALTELSSPSFGVKVSQDNGADNSFRPPTNLPYHGISSYDSLSCGDNSYQNNTSDPILTSPHSTLNSLSQQLDQFNNGDNSHQSHILGMVTDTAGPWSVLDSRQGRPPALTVAPVTSAQSPVSRLPKNPGRRRAKSSASGHTSLQDSAYFTQPKASQHEDDDMGDLPSNNMGNQTLNHAYGGAGEMNRYPSQQGFTFFAPSMQDTNNSSSYQPTSVEQRLLVPSDPASLAPAQHIQHSARSLVSSHTLRNQGQTCLECNHFSRTKSEYNKHKAQHDRVFKCSHSDCNRSHKGFSTSNDLDRHLKSVHNERNRKSVDYKCFARGCMKPEKIWPRLDNFRQHLKSMHGNEPADTLLKLSREWFEGHQRASCVQSEENMSVGQPSLTSTEDVSNADHDLMDFGPSFHGNFHDSQPDFRQQNHDVNSLQPTFAIDPMLSQMSQPPIHRTRRLSSPVPPSEIPQHPFRLMTQGTTLFPQSIPMKRTLSQLDHSQAVISRNHLSNNHGTTDHGRLAPTAWNIHNAGFSPRQVRTLDATQARIRGPYTTPNPALDSNRMSDFATSSSPVTDNFPTRQEELLHDLSASIGDVPLQSPVITIQPPDDEPRPRHVALSQVLVNDIQAFLVAYEARTDQDRSFTQEDLVEHFRLTLRSSIDTMTNGGSSIGSFTGGNPDSKLAKGLSGNKKPPYKCSFDGCNKVATRMSELKKHEVRHQKPFGCTFDGCYKTFGSKNDWKRHEQGQHEQEECWRCCKCLEVFYHRQDHLVDHLTNDHSEHPQEASRLADSNRIARNYQGQIWCGFCNEILVHKEQGVAAINYRFDHIAEHFKTKTIQAWTEFSSHGRTKGDLQQPPKDKDTSPIAEENDDEDDVASEDRVDKKNQPTQSTTSPSLSSSSSPSHTDLSPIPQPSALESETARPLNQQYSPVNHNAIPTSAYSQYNHPSMMGLIYQNQENPLSQYSQPLRTTHTQSDSRGTNLNPTLSTSQSRDLLSVEERVVCCQCDSSFTVTSSGSSCECQHLQCYRCTSSFSNPYIV